MALVGTLMITYDTTGYGVKLGDNIVDRGRDESMPLISWPFSVEEEVRPR